MTAAARLSLYDLGDEQDVLDSFLIETEGEETPEIAELWERLSGQIDEKVERWGLWLRGQQLQADLIKAEEDRLRARRKTIENAIERGKSALQMNMERLGRDKVKGKLLTVSIQKNPPAVACENPQSVFDGPQGDMFATREERVDFRLNRDAVLAAWKAGTALPAGIIVSQGQSLRLR